MASVSNLMKRDPTVAMVLVAAFISFLFSVSLWFFVDRDAGMFVGIWVPSILSFGCLIRRVR